MDEKIKHRAMENVARLTLLLRDVLQTALVLGLDVAEESAVIDELGPKMLTKYATLVGEDEAVKMFISSAGGPPN